MNQQERRYKFNVYWMDKHWDEFVAGGVENAKGNIVKVADVLNDLSVKEMAMIDRAFSFGPHHLMEAVEIIAKTYLFEVVVDELWHNHLAAEEEAGRELEWAKP